MFVPLASTMTELGKIREFLDGDFVSHLMDYEIAAIARSLKVSVGWLFGEAENRR